VLLAVLGAPIVAHPDVVALVEELELEGLLSFIEAIEPGCSVHVLAVLDEDCALWLIERFVHIANYVEVGEDVAIFSGDLLGLPVVAPVAHHIGESQVRLSS
jgi:hypothetical protein